MLAGMAMKRIRVIFETDDQVRVALNLRAVKDHCTVSDVLNRLVREAMTDDLAEAARYALSESEAKPLPRPARKSRHRRDED